MNFFTRIIDPMEAPLRRGIQSGHMIAVIGKLLTGRQARGLAHNLVAFNDEPGAVRVFDHPFAAEKCDRAVGTVTDRNEVDKCVRLVRWQTRTAVVITQLIKGGDEAGDLAGAAGHKSKEARIAQVASGFVSCVTRSTL